MENELKEIPYGYCHCGCGEKTTISNCNNAKQNRVKDEPVKFIRGHNKTSSKGTLGYKKKICKNGHERTPENVWKNGCCKICGKNNSKKYRINNPEKMKKARLDFLINNSEYQKQYRNIAKNKFKHNTRNKLALKLKYEQNPEKYRQKSRERVLNISNSYVASNLQISVKEIPDYVLNLAKEIILSKRQLKKLN